MSWKLAELLTGAGESPLVEVAWEKHAIATGSGRPRRVYVDDAILWYRNGRNTFVQVKQSEKRWTVARLVESGVLDAFARQWREERGRAGVRLELAAGPADLSPLRAIEDLAGRVRNHRELVSDEAGRGVVEDVLVLGEALPGRSWPAKLRFLSSLHFEPLPTARSLSALVQSTLTAAGMHAHALAVLLLSSVTTSRSIHGARSAFTRDELVSWLRGRAPAAVLRPFGEGAEAITVAASAVATGTQRSVSAGSALAQAIVDHQRAGPLAVWIEKFVTHYLGYPGSPVPFGGRSAEFSTLDAWLTGEPATHLVLAAEAGRGKSALVVRWLDHLVLPGWSVLYFPVSARYGTNLASTAWRMIASVLCALHGEPFPSEGTGPEGLRAITAALLQRALPEDRPLLVVLDGLDEAVDFDFASDLLPPPTESLRILVSARRLVGDASTEEWADRLGWSRSRARFLGLDKLSAAEVAEVLGSLTAIRQSESEWEAIVAELQRLSGGDPLVLRLYVERLLDEDSVRLGLRELTRFKPGWQELAANLRRHNEIHADELPPLHVQLVQGVLAKAASPLTTSDLIELLSDGGPATSLELRRTLRPLRRLVVGNGESQGYVLSHPRLADLFLGEMTAGERGEIEERFLRYGERTLKRLAEGELTPEDVSAYLLRNLRGHFTRREAGSEVLVSLLSREWHDAWVAQENALYGFASDVDATWTALEREDRVRVETGLAKHVVSIVRSAVLVGSIRCASQGLSANLIRALIRTGVWSLTEAMSNLAVGWTPKNSDSRVYRESVLRVLLRTGQLEGGLLRQFVQISRTLGDEWERNNALVDLLPLFAEGEARAEIVEEVYHYFATRVPSATRLNRLANLADYLPEDERLVALETLREELEELRGREWSVPKARVFLQLARSRPGESRALRDEVRRLVDSEVSSLRDGAEILLELALQLTGREAERTFQQVLALSAQEQESGDWECFPDWFVSLAPRFPGSLRRKVAALLRRAFQYNIENEGLLLGLEEIEPIVGRRPTLSLYRRVSPVGDYGSPGLAARLSESMPDAERADILRRALIHVRTSSAANHHQVENLAQIAAALPRTEGASVAREALRASRRVGGELPLERLRISVSGFLEVPDCDEAFELGLEGVSRLAESELIRCKNTRLLVGLTPWLQPQHANAVFEWCENDAEQLDNKGYRQEMLSSMVAALNGSAREAVLRKMLDGVRANEPGSLSLDTFLAVAPNTKARWACAHAESWARKLSEEEAWHKADDVLVCLEWIQDPKLLKSSEELTLSLIDGQEYSYIPWATVMEKATPSVRLRHADRALASCDDNSHGYRLRILVGLIEVVSQREREPLLQRARVQVIELREQAGRYLSHEDAEAAIRLADFSTGQQKCEDLLSAWDLTMQVRPGMYREYAMAELGRRLHAELEELSPIDVHEYLCRTLRAAADQSRTCVLNDLSFLVPVVHRLAGRQGICDMMREVDDVAEWWP